MDIRACAHMDLWAMRLVLVQVTTVLPGVEQTLICLIKSLPTAVTVRYHNLLSM